ncbi:hypothetical protein Hypma_005046 [Hypsizygus marmoreus]|uniref:DUF6534 domain-containing protein n=1 Tax=Hypsizygus marmoreus TaxID=39966 RepID=A0A369K5C1_HYPMA|nr:hypothetical protein Hypma_005046 [Hypsizygus marmoreus]
MAAASVPAPLINFASVESPFLIGTMVSCALYGITCAQTVYYYRTYPVDHIYRKILVGILFLLETVHLMLVGEASHFFFVVCKVPEKLAGMFLIRTTFAASFAITVVLTSLVQGFYAWRVWSVSNLHKFRMPIVGIIVATSFTQFCLGITADVFLYTDPELTHVHDPLVEGLYSSQLAVAMTCDIAISLALVYFLNQSRSGFRSTENIIDRLILYSVNVGLVTSAISIVTFATFHALPSTTMFTLFTEIISKIYVNSLLVTLNSRNNIKRVLEKHAAEAYPLSGTSFSQTRVLVTAPSQETPSLDAKGRV